MTDASTPLDVWSQLSVDPDDYEWALIHLVWRGFRGTKKGNADNELVFGMVELLPREFPRPTPAASVAHSLHSGREGYLRVTRASAPAAPAAAWFRDVRSGNPRFPPKEDGSEGPPGLRIDATLWEPEWPFLSTVRADHSASVPYVAAAHACPRLIHRVCSQRLVLDDLSEDSRSGAHDFLGDQLCFPLDRFPELIGSLHLVLPNPVHRPPQVRYIPDERRILVHIPPRPRQTLAGLELLVRNELHSGASSLQRTLLTHEFTKVSFREPVDRVSLDVVCPRRGLLHSQGPSTWIGSVELASQMIGQRRQVRIEDHEGRTTDEYTVEVGTTEKSLVGERASTSGRSVLAEGQQLRRVREEAQRYRQQVFIRSRRDAADFVRSIVGSARDRLTIVDPYFGAADLYAFALATRERDLPVRVLAWVGHLARRDKANGGSRPAEALSEAVLELQSRSGVGVIEVLVMGSASAAAIHDRFILVDDDCWLLGSSLNSFGTAGTVCLRVPDGATVLDMIDAELERSPTLQHWIATHPIPPTDPAPPERFPTSRIRAAARCIRDAVGFPRDR